jgi:tetratricopeptide (TPR) repeat protein
MTHTNDVPDPIHKAIEVCQKAMAGNNFEQAEAAAVDLLNRAAEWREQHPTPESALTERAWECEARGDWAGAEAAYRDRLALEETTSHPGMLAKAHLDLSRLLVLVGDAGQAEQHAQAAVEAARRAQLQPLTLMALDGLARCALRRSDYAGALRAAADAIAATEPELAATSPLAGTRQLHSRALALQARCRIALGDLAGAERDLAASKPTLLEHEVSTIFAGRLAQVADWWETSAQLAACQGDLEGAAAAWIKAAQYRRLRTSAGQLSRPRTLAALAGTLRHLGQALEAAGRTVEAQAALAEAKNIQCELGLPEGGTLD